MKKLLLVLMTAVLVAACSEEDKRTEIEPPPGPPSIAERTVLFYQLVDDTQLIKYFESDFYEAVEGMALVDDILNNFLVFSYLTDQPYLIYLQKNGIGQVIADTIKVFPPRNPLEKGAMADVFQYVIDEYPAKDYGLIMASHAHGWKPASKSANSRSFGQFGGKNMDIADLREVLESFPRLNFLLFDACYMQAIEVAYELRHCADYIIGSPTEIPGPGAPYQKLVPLMFQSTEHVAANLAQAYYSYYKDYSGFYTFPGGTVSEWKWGVSVSAIKTSELEGLAEITNDILSEYIPNRKQISISSLLHYDGYDRRYYDFDGMMKLITGEDSKYQLWREAFDRVQPYFETTSNNYANEKGGSFKMDRAAGISVFIPNSNLMGDYIDFYRTLEWYKAGGWQAAGW